MDLFITVPANKIKGLLIHSHMSAVENDKDKKTVNTDDSHAENIIIIIAKKAISVLLIIFAIVAIFSPLRTIILQAAIVMTGLWALISGKIWIIDDKYTVRPSNARGIGALLISAVPLSLIGDMIVINQYDYTSDAKSYGTLIEVGIFGAIAFIAYVIYRKVRQVK